jgi:hypothetical protein
LWIGAEIKPTQLIYPRRSGRAQEQRWIYSSEDGRILRFSAPAESPDAFLLVVAAGRQYETFSVSATDYHFQGIHFPSSHALHDAGRFIECAGTTNETAQLRLFFRYEID